MVRIAETTTRIIGSFKWADLKVSRRIASKYGRRKRYWTWNLIHNVTKQIVTEAFTRKEAIVLRILKAFEGSIVRGTVRAGRTGAI